MQMADKIKVMVVNDSPYMRKFLTDLITSSPKLQVNDTARDGVEALRKLRQNRPNVVLLDLDMPKMDGFTFIEQVMKEEPIPIVVVSSYSEGNAKIVFDSLECGAVDFVPISEQDTGEMRQLQSNLVSKILIAAETKPNLLQSNILRSESTTKDQFKADGAASQVVVIGASTGGPRIINDILSQLPSDLPAGVLIVQHMPNGFTAGFAKHLNERSKLKVKEAEDGDIIKEGIALLAPGDYHMLVKPVRCIELNKGPKKLGLRPSVNMSMISASEVYGSNTVGVLLSGMGHDGAFGMKMIKKKGGITIAQDETSSVVFGMAKAAHDLNVVDKVVPAESIAQEIVMAVERHDG